MRHLQNPICKSLLFVVVIMATSLCMFSQQVSASFIHDIGSIILPSVSGRRLLQASCLAGTYWDSASTSCIACPTHSTSVYGSTGLSSCKCTSGYWLDLATTEQCVTCSAGLTSPVGSTSSDQCVCPAGTYGTGGTCTSCATSASSPMGSTVSTDCYCNSGFYGLDASTSCTACPSSSVSPSGSTTIDQCICIANTYRDADTCPACPATSTSPAGSDAITDCSCPTDDFLDIASSSCQDCPATMVAVSGSTSCICPANDYLDADTGTCITCPPDSTNPTGSIANGLTDCKCGAGTYMDTVTKTCVGCPAGAFADPDVTGPESCSCPTNTFLNTGTNTCDACPDYSTTNGLTGQTGIGSCVCNTEYHVKQGDGTCLLTCPANSIENTDDQTCIFCPVNTYKSGSTCSSCPAWSRSPAGSSAVEDCVCVAGTYYDDVNIQCLACGIGNVCPGDGTQMTCSSLDPVAQAACDPRTLETPTKFSTSSTECQCYSSGS